MRTGTGAELAEHAATEVVLIFDEALFLFAISIFVKFAGHLDGAIGAGHLAKSATHTFVFVVFVVWHGQRTTKAVEHFQFSAVFRILLGDFGGEKLTHGRFQTGAEGFQTAEQPLNIVVFVVHEFCDLFDFSLSLHSGRDIRRSGPASVVPTC